MGDDMFDFAYDDFENVLELMFTAPAERKASVADVRRTLEAAVRKIPDSALHGFKSFRIMVASAKKR